MTLKESTEKLAEKQLNMKPYNEKLLNEISLKMQEINLELDELSERRKLLKDMQSKLIADWQRSTK